MNLIFNEISFLPYEENEHILEKNFINLITVFEKAKQLYGFKHILFPINIGAVKVTSTLCFSEWIYNISNTGNKNKILSIIKKPYSEDILDEKRDDLHKYLFINEELKIEEYCIGLATSYLKKSLSASLFSIHLWGQHNIEFLKILNENWESERVSVQNISKVDHFQIDTINAFIEEIKTVELIESFDNPQTKQISLRDDHGRNKLFSFSKKLVQSKYVVSVINSLPFNPKIVNLIKEVYPDGKIEMVLYWEDKGIGLVVQTTGRNYKETLAISQKLKKEYDR